MLAVSCQTTKVNMKGERVETAAKRHWERIHPNGSFAGRNYIGAKEIIVTVKK